MRRTGGRERAILVGVGGKGKAAPTREASLAELRELARTAGVEVVDASVQMRRDPDPRTLIGKGKLEDILLRSMQLMADLIIFDADLSPSQARHIAEATGLKVLDRTQLILDIFAQRAQSADGKLQVELAQLKYLYPAPRRPRRLALAPGRRHRRPRPRRDQARDRPAPRARPHHRS